VTRITDPRTSYGVASGNDCVSYEIMCIQKQCCMGGKSPILSYVDVLFKQILSLRIEIFAVCDRNVRSQKYVSDAYKCDLK
jgi:hypothetical protein